MVVSEKKSSSYSGGIYSRYSNNQPKPEESFFLSWLPGCAHLYFGKQKFKGVLLLASFVLTLISLILVVTPGLSNFLINALLAGKEQKIQYASEILNFSFTFKLVISLLMGFFIFFLFSENQADINANFNKTEKDNKPALYGSSFSSSYLVNLSGLFVLVFYGLIYQFVPVQKEHTIELTNDLFVSNPPQKNPPKEAPKDAKRESIQNAVNSGRHVKNLPVVPGQPVPKKSQKTPPSKPQKAVKPQNQQSQSQATKSPQSAPKAFSVPKFAVPNPFSQSKPTASEPTNKSVLPSFKPKTASEDKPILSSNESGPTFKVKPVIASASSAAASSASYSGGGIGRGPVLPSSSPGGFSNGGTQGNSNANGNPNGPITVAARQDVDYGPYRQDLERRIHQAWRAPEHDKDSRVLVSFAIKRDGSLVTTSIRTTQSSSPEAEAAARQAIYDASPGFRPLPDGAPDSVRVDFTFTQTGTRFAGIKKY